MNIKAKKLSPEDRKLGILEKLRVIFKRMFIGGIVLFFLFIFVGALCDNSVFLTLALIALGSIAVGYILKKIVEWIAKKEAVKITPRALKRALDRLDDYNPQGHVSDSYIHSISDCFPSFDRISDQRDYVRGVLRGVPVEFSEFSLLEKHEERDEDGDIKETYSKIYSGIILLAKHGYELKEDILITQHVGNLFGGMETESYEFNKLFHIRKGDGHEVFYFLTPQYIEKLINLSRAKGKSFSISLLVGGELVLTLSGRNYFEASGATTEKELIGKIGREMEELGDILEELEVPKEGSTYPMGKAD